MRTIYFTSRVRFILRIIFSAHVCTPTSTITCVSWKGLRRKIQISLSVINTLLFHDGGRYHIETSPLICSANQWSGFYVITASVMKELTLLLGTSISTIDKKNLITRKWDLLMICENQRISSLSSHKKMCWRFRIITAVTFWVMRTRDISNVCLQIYRNSRIC